ncbi:MAG: VanZ family protein [Desulfobacca sp.]|nr:VanZ family protein [Desulfobacca sp.]
MASESAKVPAVGFKGQKDQAEASTIHVFGNPHLMRICYYWLPPLLLTGLVLLFSGELGDTRHTYWIVDLVRSWFPAMTRKDADLIHVYFRKFGHFSAYALLFMVWVRTVRWHLDFSPTAASLLSLTIILVVALVDEGSQAFIKTRTSNPWDVLLDLSGAVFANLVVLPFLRRTPAWKRKNIQGKHG